MKKYVTFDKTLFAECKNNNAATVWFGLTPITGETLDLDVWNTETALKWVYVIYCTSPFTKRRRCETLRSQTTDLTSTEHAFSRLFTPTKMATTTFTVLIRMCRGSVGLQIHLDVKADFEFRWDLVVVANGMRMTRNTGMVGGFWRKRTPQEVNEDTVQQKTLTLSELHGD